MKYVIMTQNEYVCLSNAFLNQLIEANWTKESIHSSKPEWFRFTWMIHSTVEQISS